MYDWNKNGKYDMQDSFIDYHINSNMKKEREAGNISDGFMWFCMIITFIACPPLAILVFIVALFS